MIINHFLKIIFFGFLCSSMISVKAMFDDTYDYYDQLNIEINIPQNKILQAFTKKIKPYFNLLGNDDTYKAKTLRERLILYDNQNGLPLRHKAYEKDKKAFDVLNDSVQRKAYDVHKGYDAPEPQAPTDYHNDAWCTGYCKKYNHKINAVDKEKLIGQMMPLNCGHKVCMLCVEFDPVNKCEGCPFKMKMAHCGCSICPLRLEKHLVGDYEQDCPVCEAHIPNVAHVRQQMMKNMSFQDYFHYLLPPGLRPFATKWHFGLVLTSIFTAQFVHYFGKKVQLYKQFESLESVADLAVSSLLSFEFEQLDDAFVLGLQEHFDMNKFIICLKSEELKANFIQKIADFDANLKSVYEIICAKYYYDTVENFIRKEQPLITALTASLAALKESINASRIALDIKKTSISPKLKALTGLCVGGVIGSCLWSNIK